MTRLALALAALAVLAAGCLDHETVSKPESPSTTTEPPIRWQFDADDLGADLGVPADSVNAIARAQHAAAGKNPGWQLYVPIQFFSQNDPAWRNHTLGYNYCGDSTIGRYGCLLACICMVLRKLGVAVNPHILNDWAAFGYSHYAFSRSGCGDLIDNAHAISYPNQCRPWRVLSYDEIYTQLARGRPVVAKIRTELGNHFVVIYAFDGARYWVLDPYRTTGYERPLYGTFLQARLYGYTG